MASARKLAEFSISKDRLIQALACISNLADRAIVRAIVHPKDVILGFAFSNVLSDDQSGDELYADYAIVKEEMIDPNFLVKSEEWPLFFVSCTEAFISSIMTLEPRENQFLKIEFYNILEEDAPEDGQERGSGPGRAQLCSGIYLAASILTRGRYGNGG